MDSSSFFGATPILNDKTSLSGLALGQAALTVLCVSDCRARLLEIAKLSEKIDRLEDTRVDIIVAVGLEESAQPAESQEEEVAVSVDGELSATISALENVCGRVVYHLGRPGYIRPSTRSERIGKRLTQHSYNVERGPLLVAADLIVTHAASKSSTELPSRLWPPWGSSLMGRLNNCLDKPSLAPVGALQLEARVILIEAEPSPDPPTDTLVLKVQPQLGADRKEASRVEVTDSSATVHPGSLQEGHFVLVHLARLGPGYRWSYGAINEMNLYR